MYLLMQLVHLLSLNSIALVWSLPADRLPSNILNSWQYNAETAVSPPHVPQKDNRPAYRREPSFGHGTFIGMLSDPGNEDPYESSLIDFFHKSNQWTNASPTSQMHPLDTNLHMDTCSTKYAMQDQDWNATWGSHGDSEHAGTSSYEVQPSKDQSEILEDSRSFEEEENLNLSPSTKKHVAKKNESKSKHWIWLMQHDRVKCERLMSLISILNNVREGTAEYRLRHRLTKEFEQDLFSDDSQIQMMAARVFDFTFPGDLFTEKEKEVLFDKYVRRRNGEKYKITRRILLAAKQFIPEPDQLWIESIPFKTPEDYLIIARMIKDAYRLFNKKTFQRYEDKEKVAIRQKKFRDKQKERVKLAS